MIHYAVWCREPSLSKQRRAEMLFLATAMLLDFKVNDSFAETSILHCFGQIFSLIFHDNIVDPKKTGSKFAEALLGLTKCMLRGNHEQIAVADFLDLFGSHLEIAVFVFSLFQTGAHRAIPDRRTLQL